jgi:imidazolonepropionase-like amidohydrolase
VLVEDGRIVTVDRSGAAAPPHAEVVELADATLLPGLVDAHVHLAFEPTGHPLVDVLGVDDEVLLSRMRSNAARALAAGITTVRDLGDARHLTGRVRSGWTGGPELLMSGPPITRTGGHCWFLGGAADGVDGVRAAVAQRVAAGVDIIKIMATGGLMTPGFGVHESQYGPVELRAACEAARGFGLAVTAHAHGPRGIAESVAAGVDGVEHATFLTADGAELDVDTVDRLAAAGAFVGVTEAWLPGGRRCRPPMRFDLSSAGPTSSGCSGPVSAWCAVRTRGSGRASRTTCCRTESSCSPASGSAPWRRWPPRPAWRRGPAGSAAGRAGWPPLRRRHPRRGR